MGTIPGLLVTPDPNGGLPVISALGLSSSQNTLTLNGMNFGGGNIPRDELVLRVAQSTYDPGRVADFDDFSAHERELEPQRADVLARMRGFIDRLAP